MASKDLTAGARGGGGRVRAPPARPHGVRARRGARRSASTRPTSRRRSSSRRPTGYARAVLPASERLDLRKLGDFARRPASKKVHLASEEALARDYPEFELGAVPPLGGSRATRSWSTGGSPSASRSCSRRARTTSRFGLRATTSSGSPAPRWRTSPRTERRSDPGPVRGGSARDPGSGLLWSCESPGVRRVYGTGAAVKELQTHGVAVVDRRRPLPTLGCRLWPSSSRPGRPCRSRSGAVAVGDGVGDPVHATVEA